MIPERISRRRFLQVALASSASLAAGCETAAPLPGFPFTLGVASGDPLADRVVLWTRLAPEPLAAAGDGGMPARPVPVVWQVAHDEGFRSVVRSGLAVASPELGHSVHVDVGGLEPGRWYWYRFLAAGYASDAGRTRTAPAPGARPALLRLASASCQDFRAGYYTSYASMVQEDLDLVVFLGDYIYESGGSDVRFHRGGLLDELASYRNRYAQYRGGDPEQPEPNLREAHRLFPWVVTWDDHEVQNNYAGLVSQSPGAFPPAAFAALRARAYQAWWEHMPVRLPSPKSASLRIYRELAFGDLLRIFVLDTRQQRSDQPCEDAPGGIAGLTNTAQCPGFPPEDGTMLGAAQEGWLFGGLERSGALWNVLAQQVVFSPLPIGDLANLDQWDGYPLARERIVGFLREQAVRNPVVLTGDIHASGAGAVPGDLETFLDPVASELVATGISSSGLPAELVGVAESVLQGLPHVRYFDGVRRGYLRHEVTPSAWRADFRLVESVATPSAPVSTAASFAIEDGHPDPQPA